MIKKTTLAIVAILMCFAGVRANNLSITGTAVTGSDITFNISWENSWKTSVAPSNYDAVWVFVKYQDCATNLWVHAGLSTTLANHSAASPLAVEVTSDGKGVFLKRSANGGGNIASTAISLRMTIPAGTYNYKVFGIEMVKVNREAFNIGDGSATSTYSSLSIDSTKQANGILAATIGGGSLDVPSTFPMGFGAYYTMKYETSQEQYKEFLNTLTYDQQVSRVGIDPAIAAVGSIAIATGTFRFGIVLKTQGNNNVLPGVFACDMNTANSTDSIDDGQSLPCGYLKWADVAAYLDWAALRPMTEMEFEKTCRGPLASVANEYPWGTTNIYPILVGNMSNLNRATEISSDVQNGLCHYYAGTGSYLQGPMRCGMPATGSTGRQSSGAAYYGAMEMGGNLSEMTITTMNTAGTAFTGVNGDGELTSIGNANVTNWPGITALGTGTRGSTYAHLLISYVRTSDRSLSDDASSNPTRYYYNGCRGVR